jgi:uncharacterized membrane protein
VAALALLLTRLVKFLVALAEKLIPRELLIQAAAAAVEVAAAQLAVVLAALGSLLSDILEQRWHSGY